MGHAATDSTVTTWTWFKGEWHEGNPNIMGPQTHGVWMASTVFDGARRMNGKMPDLHPHCARVIRSANLMGLKPAITADEIVALVKEGVKKFDPELALYIKPIVYGGEGFLAPVPESAQFVLCISVTEMPAAVQTGFSARKSSFRRPSPESAPTEAKAACLYPNVGRAVTEANNDGFDTGVMLDPIGNVAEFSYANLFFAKDNVVYTPAINGTFLNGLTRQRVITLLRKDGVEVVEKTCAYSELEAADEIFGTGNYYKVAPCVKLDERALQPGPITRRAQELYIAFTAASSD
ncbi:branched-chain amino acid aminotransferase [Thalassospira lucentensis]|uniref:Probable branched-chain-amino-acid aminotransferase n=1 Tax=Thalassospira lucentensis TaxID=168935 RepID=A0A358HV03_9PROT|nr:branched-chain amino acid aminotransferase [Thalassospira lucentensis]HBU98998.1 branched-chain amino acid aminotransferase [Thalassospira lucentensis]HCW69733.1 branched-chain amino acid aminotransferase [Thalassospira lucentensis]